MRTILTILLAITATTIPAGCDSSHSSSAAAKLTNRTNPVVDNSTVSPPLPKPK